MHTRQLANAIFSFLVQLGADWSRGFQQAGTLAYPLTSILRYPENPFVHHLPDNIIQTARNVNKLRK